MPCPRGAILLPYFILNSCKILKALAESERRKGPSSFLLQEQHSPTGDQPKRHKWHWDRRDPKKPHGQRQQERVLQGSYQQRGDQADLHVSYLTPLEKERERERKSAHWKKLPPRFSYLGRAQSEAVDRRATIWSKEAPGPHCGCSRLADTGLARCRV